MGCSSQVGVSRCLRLELAYCLLTRCWWLEPAYCLLNCLNAFWMARGCDRVMQHGTSNCFTPSVSLCCSLLW